VVRNKAELVFRIQNLRERLIRGVEKVLRRRRDEWTRMQRRLKDPRRRLAELRLRADDRVGRLAGLMGRMLDERRLRLESLVKNLLYRSPRQKVDRLRDSLRQRAERLDSAATDFLSKKRRVLERSMDRLEAMSPLRILRRGYSIVRRIPSMEIVRDSRAVRRGEGVDVRLHQGRLICRVEETKGESGRRSPVVLRLDGAGE
ncbi:MAG: hypothetical protein JRH07_13815, partial [Deltaproteobacteria bacterium]|nr:hypothetical protein [Deltaproteobacteria bacterium]